MALLGDGVLLTFTEVPEAREEDFNEWYNREHLDERVGMPGFRRARRYIAVEGGATDGTPKYFASYETGTVEDLHDARAGSIYIHAVTQLEISSSALRSLIARGGDPRFLMPDGVRDVIDKSGCYRQPREKDTTMAC